MKPQTVRLSPELVRNPQLGTVTTPAALYTLLDKLNDEIALTDAQLQVCYDLGQAYLQGKESVAYVATMAMRYGIAQAGQRVKELEKEIAGIRDAQDQDGMERDLNE